MTNKRQPRYSKGQRIGNRFLVHQALMGGMGEVYLCLDEEEMMPLALKTFQSSSPELADIFKREVASWIALEKHPNIVRCFYMQKYDNLPFMLLEWVAGDESRGSDLRSWLRRGPLDLPLALRFTIDIMHGLIHANEKVPGIVHRDLKPDNVLFNQSKQAKITDFGLATVTQLARLDGAGADEADMGQSCFVGSIVGTPAYMPPEQWRGEADIDFRADVYAVGCIMYESLTGKWLYDARTISELRAQHLEAPLPDLNGDLPADLKSILEGCLAKRREDRFERLDWLLADLTKLYNAHSDEPLPEVTAEDFTSEDYNNRGTTFANLGQQARAIADFDRAVQLDPTNAIAYHNRGHSYGDLGQHERAIADYNRAIQFDSTYAKAYSNRGTGYVALGQHERAIQDFDRAIEVEPDLGPAYSNRGISYAALGQHERAIQDFDHAIQLDPAYAIAYYNRGTSYAELGQHARAIADFDRAIQFDPTYAKAYYNRGNCYVALRQQAHAVQDYDCAIQLNPTDAKAYYNRGHSYDALGQHERAIQDYDEAIRLDANNAKAYFNKGALLANTGRLQESLPLFEKAYTLGNQRAAGEIQQVRQALGLPAMQIRAVPNDPQAAFEAFQRADSLDAMRQVVGQFPILAQMISTIEQVIQQQVPPQLKPDFERRLGWLKQVIGGT